MHRRILLSSGLALVGAGALSPLARAQSSSGSANPPPSDYGPPPPPPPPAQSSSAPPSSDYAPPPPVGAEPMTPPHNDTNYKAETYSNDELVNQVSDFFGVTAEKAGGIIERVFRDNGRPTGYIAGQEGSGAFGIGLRYGEGLLYMKHQPAQKVFWQGPSFGWDVGGNASRVFTLCYNLQYPDMIYRRFPGVEGTAYFIGGLGVNYARAEDVTLAPIRAGVGFRLGANLGYLAYTRDRHIIPL
jgi:hypothetical protein